MFFQAREAVNPFYAAVPAIVQQEMARLGERTGQSYRLFDYVGHPEAERCSSSWAPAQGRPRKRWSTLRPGREGRPRRGPALPPVRRSGVHRRAPGRRVARRRARPDEEEAALAEPLYQDIVTALAERAGTSRIIGGRYGLSSKEFTPAMAAAALAELERPTPKAPLHGRDQRRRGGLSLDVDPELTTEPLETRQAVFYGLGSDGRSARTGTRSGSSPRRRACTPRRTSCSTRRKRARRPCRTSARARAVRSTYLVQRADFVACHQFGFLDRIDVLALAGEGRPFP